MVCSMKRISTKKPCLDVSAIESNDVQLWLLKVPDTMDVTALNGTTLQMGSAVTIGGTEYTISEGSPLESDSLLNIWPDSARGKMALGKPFSKILHVSETTKAQIGQQATQIVQNLAAFLKFGTTRTPLSATNYDEHDTPELKVRYVPAGATLPTAIPSHASSSTRVEVKREPSMEFKSHSSHKEGKHKHKEGKHKHKEGKHRKHE